ncbi:hypothetical protein J4471_03425 [Candidatus Woesearchaeota archaeon]|nr:hypothetical protein [Candidatus Woesearchaeota archaeon]
MTVGISLSNGLESIVITDSQSTYGEYRESASSNKLGQFKSSNYHGVIFGTGSANIHHSITSRLNNFEGEKLDEYVQSINSYLFSQEETNSANYLKGKEREIHRKAIIIVNDEERKNFVSQQTLIALSDYDKLKSQNPTYFVLVAFDILSNKIRKFVIDSNMVPEQFHSHMEIGSGSDGANFYFTTKLQGVDTSKLQPAELTFFVCNAYCLSTINTGVGGTPKIASVNKDGVHIISVGKTRALTNLSGAYLSEFRGKRLFAQKTLEFFEEILNTDSPNYDKISKYIGVSKNTLISTEIPYSNWQERANSSLFKDK